MMNRNVTSFILIVLGAGIYFTYTSGAIADARAAKSVNDGYVSAIDSADKLIQVRDKVRDAYNNISPDDRDKLDKMIPSTVDNIQLIIDLNSVALRHGFSLKDIKAAAADNNSAPTGSQTSSAVAGGNAGLSDISTPVLDTVNVSFSVTAAYNQFISFMQDLEADLRIMDLTNLTVKANDTGVYDFSVTMKTYWLRQ